MEFKQFVEGYDDNRTGFAKKPREDDEGHGKPAFKAKSTMDRPHTVHIDGKPWKKFDNGHQAHAAVKTLEGKGKKATAIAHFKEEAEVIDESMTDSWKNVQSMDKGSVTGGKDDAKKRLAYLNAVHDHHKKYGNDTKKVKSDIEALNRSRLAEDEELDEATPYYNKPSFLKNMGRIAKQERLAREKKEKEAAEKKSEVKEDVATSEYKIKKTVGQDGKTHTRKIRPHVVRFKNSKSGGEPAQDTNRDDKEDMKKESIEMVSFSQFQQEGVMDTLKKVGKKVLDTVGHGDDEAMKKDLQKKMGVPQTGKPSMAKQNEELKGDQHKLDKNKNGKVDAHDFKLLRKEDTPADPTPVAPTIARKYIKGTPEHKAYKASKQKPMYGLPTGKYNEEFELQEESIVESRVNHREFASDGRMHPSMANHSAYKAGGGSVDFYAHGTGDKVEGKVTKNDGKHVHIQDTKGKTHKFQVSNTAPHQMKEEFQLDEKVDIKNMPMGDVVTDFQQSDAPQFAGKSKEKRQQMAIAAKLSADRGGKKMSFKEMMEIYSAPAIVEGSDDEKENEVAEANAFDWKSGGHKDSGKFDKKTTATGTQYTRKYDPKTGETKDDSSEPAEKRGRGRPTGSKTGAAQKGSEKKSDYRGIDRTTYAIHLPK